MSAQATAAIITIGNELVCGDVEDTNGSWLAKRLERLGLAVQLIAAVPDDVRHIAAVVRGAAGEADCVLVTGGLGGTPDDVTREAIAQAFAVGRAEAPDVAERLRARFRSDPDYAARWALLERGERVILVVAHGLTLRYLLNAIGGRTPTPTLEDVPYAEPFRLTAAEVANGVERLEAWCAAPAW